MSSRDARRAAKMIYEQHGYSQEAVAMLARRRGLAEDLKLAGADYYLSEAMRDERTRMRAVHTRELAEHDPKEPWAEVLCMADFPMMRGIKLRGASEADIEEQIAIYQRERRGLELAEQFMQAVLKARRAAKAPADALTGEVLTDAQIEAIRESVYGRAA